MRRHVPQNIGTYLHKYYAQCIQICKISLTFIYLFKEGENPTQHIRQSSGRHEANSNLAQRDATLQASARLKLVHTACQSSGSVLLQQGRQVSVSGKGCARMGTSIPDWLICSGSCTGQIGGVLSHLAHFLHKCYPSAPIFAHSAKVTASLPLAQYLSCWNIFALFNLR